MGHASAARVTSPSTEVVEVGGLRLRVSIHGRGRPLLLLNGLGASLELLEPFRQALEATETIAIEVPGTGRSQTTRLPRRLGAIVIVRRAGCLLCAKPSPRT